MPPPSDDLGRERVVVDVRRAKPPAASSDASMRHLPEHRGELVDGRVHDLEHQLRVDAEHDDRDQHRRPRDPLEDLHVVDVVVVLGWPPRRRRGRAAVAANSSVGSPNAVRWYSHSR